MLRGMKTMHLLIVGVGLGVCQVLE